MSDSNIDYFIRKFNLLLLEARRNQKLYEAVVKEIYKTNPCRCYNFYRRPVFLRFCMILFFKMWKDMVQEIYPAPFCKKYDQVSASHVLLRVSLKVKGTEILMYMALLKRSRGHCSDKINLGRGMIVLLRNVLSLALEETCINLLLLVMKITFVICNSEA